MAIALLLRPRLLLVDEPSLGLDPRMVEVVFDTILEINREGTTVLMVEQNAKKALSVSHRGFVLELGRNRFEGTGQELLDDPGRARSTTWADTEPTRRWASISSAGREPCCSSRRSPRRPPPRAGPMPCSWRTGRACRSGPAACPTGGARTRRSVGGPRTTSRSSRTAA